MSMSVGPFCDINQDVDSKDWKTGAVVAIKMDENERECKQLYFSIYDLSASVICTNENVRVFRDKEVKCFALFSFWLFSLLRLKERLQYELAEKYLSIYYS